MMYNSVSNSVRSNNSKYGSKHVNRLLTTTKSNYCLNTSTTWATTSKSWRVQISRKRRTNRIERNNHKNLMRWSGYNWLPMTAFYLTNTPLLTWNTNPMPFSANRNTYSCSPTSSQFTPSTQRQPKGLKRWLNTKNSKSLGNKYLIVIWCERSNIHWHPRMLLKCLKRIRQLWTHRVGGKTYNYTIYILLMLPHLLFKIF